MVQRLNVEIGAITLILSLSMSDGAPIEKASYQTGLVAIAQTMFTVVVFIRIEQTALYAFHQNDR